ncbi:hypothetical protein AB1Y20_014920 [Prymnesium parvum]|uniref:Uncharacterized protein n=1 Tax=Prymnesium parvum TaxID=97485 RepID=A0AB34JYL8_PRYPA
MLTALAAVLGLCFHAHCPWVPSPRRTAVHLVAVANELPRPVPVSSIERRARRLAVEATAEECAALAARFDLVSIGSLVANVSLSVIDPRRTRVRAYGQLSARNVQRENFAGEVTTIQVDDLAFETFFQPEEELQLNPENDDEFKYDEPIENDQLDIGEMVAQHLYLHLYGLALQEQSEWRDDLVEGTVVIDTNPELE